MYIQIPNIYLGLGFEFEFGPQRIRDFSHCVRSPCFYLSASNYFCHWAMRHSVREFSFRFRFDQNSHLNWTIAMSQHRIEYFDEGSSIPKIIFLFHLISLAFKSCFKSNQPTQQEKDQTNSRKAQYIYYFTKTLPT